MPQHQMNVSQLLSYIYINILSTWEESYINNFLLAFNHFIPYNFEENSLKLDLIWEKVNRGPIFFRSVMAWDIFILF